MKAHYIKRVDGCFAAINTQIAALEAIKEELEADLLDHPLRWQQAPAGLRQQAEIDILSDIADDLSVRLQDLDTITMPAALGAAELEEETE